MGERQQINLYQPAADLSRRPFSARAAALFVGAVLAALLGIWGYGSWQVGQVQRSVAALEEQQRRQEDRVNAAGAMHAARANPERIEARIKDLTAQLATRRHALELLRGGTEGGKVGFSARLAGLARRHVDGLWIDHIVLTGSAQGMTLEGIALDADLVPRYLRDLAQDPSLVGARFDQLVIERPGAHRAVAESPAAADRSADASAAHDSAATGDSAATRDSPAARATSRSGMRFRAESSVSASPPQAAAAS